jgi:uncharacterized protein YecE (DUF72 family)
VRTGEARERGCYNLSLYGGYSSVAERRSVDPDVVGSTPTSRPSAEMNPGPGAVFVGCSGWAYPSWKPVFYPAKTPNKKLLEHYATRLNSVEVNYTFRHLPSAATLDNWLGQVGEDFRFSFKAPQRITHIKRLKGCREALSAFFTALAPVLRARREGAILFQLPPNFKADTSTLEIFLEDAALESAAKKRLAFEFRHPSWFTDETFKVLERHDAALCVAESDDLETPRIATASFSCYRWRKSDYSEDALRQIDAQLKQSAIGGDVFAYFKHEESPAGALYAEGVLGRLRAERLRGQ